MNQNDFTLSLPPEGFSPIFIGRLYRSGTTLMRQLLDSHPHIVCGPESNLFRQNLLEQIYTYLRTIWPTLLSPRYEFDPHTVDQVMAGLVQAVVIPNFQKQDKPRWAHKTPQTILFSDTLFALFPAGQFIHMIRDPRGRPLLGTGEGNKGQTTLGNLDAKASGSGVVLPDKLWVSLA